MPPRQRQKLSRQRKEKRRKDKADRLFDRLVGDILDHKVTGNAARTNNRGREATDMVTTLRTDISTSSFIEHNGPNRAMSATLPAAERVWRVDRHLAEADTVHRLGHRTPRTAGNRWPEAPCM